MTPEIIAPIGYILAALTIGLWQGERSYRKTLEWQLALQKSRQAKILQPRGEVETRAEQPEDAGGMIDAIDLDRLIQDIMEETGCDEERARLEAETMIHAGAAGG